MKVGLLGVGLTATLASSSATPPELLIIVHGYEFATRRTPVFLRTLHAARGSPLWLHVLGDGESEAARRASAGGCAPCAVEARRSRARAAGAATRGE